MTTKSIFASFIRQTQAPVTNRGDNFTHPAFAFPPPLIGGEEIIIPPMKKPSDTFLVSSIDWVTFSVPADTKKNLAEETYLVANCLIGWKLRAINRSESNLTGCQESFDFIGIDPETGEAVQLFKIGHMHETETTKAYVIINIPGHCCAYFDMQKLSIAGAAMGAKLTRVDTAVDDFEGEFTVHRARCLYAKGAFQGKGKAHGSMPKYSQVKSGRGKQSHGKTLYIGDRKNGKLLRVYEKGLQMNDSERPKWVRWEVQFGNKDREIPWLILRNPSSFFLGAYAPFEKLFADRLIDASPAYIKTEYDAKSSRSLRELAKNGRIQYGKTISTLTAKALAIGYTHEDVINILSRDGLPRTLIMPDAAAVDRLLNPRTMNRFSDLVT